MKKKYLLTTAISNVVFATSVIGQCLTLECPSNITVIDDGSCGAVVSFESPTGLDTCLTSTITFTNAGAIGQNGPTQAQIDTAYLGTPLEGMVTSNNGIQLWTVPYSGTFRIEAKGASGYGTNAGRGAMMSGDFSLTANDVIKILVGQAGEPPVSPGTNQYGGGGGSFLATSTNTPLIVAGGGGGSWAASQNTNSDADTSINGKPGVNGPTNGAGGVNGLGGATASSADGGGGFNGDGAGTTGGKSFINGGIGGRQYGHGGFGGGGGASSWDNRRGGGGGGYSGGGGAGSGTAAVPEGGGGGSFNSGTNQLNAVAANTGHGSVTITLKGQAVPTSIIAGLPSGSKFPIGKNEVKFQAVSSSESQECSIIINVIDTTAPTLIAAFPNATICEHNQPVPLPFAKPAGGTYSGPGVSGTTFDPSLTGTGVFWVKYTDTDHCMNSDSTQITVTTCVGVDEKETETLSIAPNPANGLFNIIYSGQQSENGDLQVFNTLGKSVYHETFSYNTKQIDIRNQPNGVYILKVNLDGDLKTYRLLKE